MVYSNVLKNQLKKHLQFHMLLHDNWKTIAFIISLLFLFLKYNLLKLTCSILVNIKME